MAMGSNYNGNKNSSNQNNNFDPTFYSRLRFYNPVDSLSMTFNFWKGTFKIIISESKMDVTERPKELATIYLSPIKARIFADCVRRIIDDEDSIEAYGIDTGSSDTRGLIVISRDMGKPFILIGKVTSDGKFESSQKFYFSWDNMYSLKFSDIDTLSYTKEYTNDTELRMFERALRDYSNYASGACGASVFDTCRYEIGRQTNVLRKIAEKVGVDLGGNQSQSSSNNRSNNSFFSDSNSSKTEYKRYESIDDLESEM